MTNKLFTLFIVLSLLLVAGTTALVLSNHNVTEYIELDKTVTFMNRTFYVYKYIHETPTGKTILTKYICPYKIENTTCIVSTTSLICETFSCVEYKGMISS